jgi:hypothetical protein
VITLLLVLSVLLVAVPAAVLLDALARRAAHGSAGISMRTTPQPGANVSAFPAEVVALRLTSSGLVWLSPVDARVMTRAER